MYFLELVQQFALETGFVLYCGIGSEDVLDGETCFEPVLSAEAHEWVEAILLEDFFLEFREEHVIEETFIFHLSQIYNPVADSGTGPGHVYAIHR